MGSVTIELRAAVAADAPRLTALAHRAKARWQYPASWMDAWDRQLTITPGYLAEHRVWVATDAERIVGMCALEDRGDRWSLEHVWVEPSSQGHGVGRRLVEHVLAEARAIHPGIVELLSDPNATGFYERLGARRAGSVAAPMEGAPDRELPRYEFNVS